MAVIIQEVVGRRHGDRFYPDVSGVARSYNFYRIGPRHGPRTASSDLALGLGKTIVDGGRVLDLLAGLPDATDPRSARSRTCSKQTQTEFWAVNMGKPAGLRPDRRRPSTW